MSGKNEKNGAAFNGRPGVIEYETMFSGVLLHIAPISIPTMQAIQVKSQELFEYPDPRPYQQEEENAFAEGQLTPATDNPEYVKLCREVDAQRNAWRNEAIFKHTVRFPKYPTPQSLIDAFRPQLDELLKIGTFEDDDYNIVLKQIVLNWNATKIQGDGIIASLSEYERVVFMAVQANPLTPAEVSEGIKFFRLKV